MLSTSKPFTAQNIANTLPPRKSSKRQGRPEYLIKCDVSTPPKSVSRKSLSVSATLNEENEFEEPQPSTSVKKSRRSARSVAVGTYTQPKRSRPPTIPFTIVISPPTPTPGSPVKNNAKYPLYENPDGTSAAYRRSRGMVPERKKSNIRRIFGMNTLDSTPSTRQSTIQTNTFMSDASETEDSGSDVIDRVLEDNHDTLIKPVSQRVKEECIVWPYYLSTKSPTESRTKSAAQPVFHLRPEHQPNGRRAFDSLLADNRSSESFLLNAFEAPSVTELMKYVPLVSVFACDDSLPSNLPFFDPRYLYTVLISELHKLTTTIPHCRLDPYLILADHCEAESESYYFPYWLFRYSTVTRRRTRALSTGLCIWKTLVLNGCVCLMQSDDWWAHISDTYPCFQMYRDTLS